MDVRMFTVGPSPRTASSSAGTAPTRALIVDPGDEAPKLLGAIEELGRRPAGDPAHPHALRPRRRGRAGREATGAPVYCPSSRCRCCADIMSFVPWPGLRPVRVLGRRADPRGRRAPGARGLRHRRHLHPRPQPRSRHLRDRDEDALFSGDVLFEGSVGRVDLPGGDWPTLARSIASLLDRCPTRSASSRATWASPRSAASAPPTRSCASCGVTSKLQAPRGTFDVLPADAPPRQAVEDAAQRILEARRLPPHRDAGVRDAPSCSRAAWGRRPTSCRRRCSPSRTLAALRPEGPRRSAAPTSSTGCTSSRSR